MIKIFTLILIVLNFVILYRKNHFISSSSVWLLCFFLIYIFYPIYSNIDFVNELLIDKLALIGIIAYSVGMFLGNRIVIKNNSMKKSKTINPIPNFDLAKYLFIILFILSIIVTIRIYGISNIKLLISGVMTSRDLSINSINSTIITFVQYAMIPCILSMWVSSTNKKQKVFSIISLLLFLIESLIISFTRIFMISLLIMIFFHEMLNKNKKQQLVLSIIAVFSIIVLLIILNYIRCLGFSYNLTFETIFNFDVIFESTDFSASYNMFNELLKYESPYINLIVYLKPLFIFIPRYIWINKPETLNVQVLRYVNPRAASNGLSSGISVMGEGYATLGFFGAILYCFIWGIICSRMDKKYYNRIDKDETMSVKNIYYYIFAVLFVISGQRGDWSVYLITIIICFWIPLLILSRLTIRKGYIDEQIEEKS